MVQNPEGDGAIDPMTEASEDVTVDGEKKD